MERNLFSVLAAGLVFSAAVFGWNQSTRAALCGKCQGLMFIDSEGKCSDCGGPTASGALQLCPKCSAKRHQCEHCLAATTEKDESTAADHGYMVPGPADALPEKPHGDDARIRDPAAKPPPDWTAPAASGNPARPDESTAAQPTGPEINLLPPVPAKTERPTPQEPLPESKPPAELPPDPVTPLRLKPINPAKAGTYTAGKWRYQLQIISPGARSEGRWGWLTYDGRKLPRGAVNDYYITPWGPMYWVDVPATAWGVHGWMPVPLPQNRRQGRPLTIPASLLAAAPIPPAAAARDPQAGALPPPSAAIAPVGPRVQTLEINKSHNGQLARLRVGNVLIIRLPGDPATGYQWQAATTNSPALRLTVRPQYSPPASTATQAASPGTYTFTFQAVQPGSGSIRLYYVRPRDPSRPRDSFAVSVNVSPAATTFRPAANSGQAAQ
jgi:inhibitor of cysteine peptidase